MASAAKSKIGNLSGLWAISQPALALLSAKSSSVDDGRPSRKICQFCEFLKKVRDLQNRTNVCN